VTPPRRPGFGVSTREHFLNVSKIVVVGSQIVTIIGNASTGEAAKAGEEYCANICGRTNQPDGGLTREASRTYLGAMHEAKEPNRVYVDEVIRERKMT
jgi:tryptophan synthase